MTQTPSKSHARLSARPSLKPRDLMSEAPRVKGAWEARIVTLFPDAFPGILGQSLTGRALDMGLWRLETFDLRQFGIGKHRNVDDTPAGGGAGMVLRADVVDAALAAAQTQVQRTEWPLIYASPRGKPFDQATAHRFAQCQGVTFLCGRFEGVDQRVLDHHQIEEISLGDFILTGGELAVQAMIDAAVRLLPSVLGNAESIVEESFSDGLLEHPQYTRPQIWNARPIPDVLLCGDHARIKNWRKAMRADLTQAQRPDLWAQYAARKTLDPKG